MRNLLLILSLLLTYASCVNGQTVIDSVVVREQQYPLVIGSIAFSTDSVEIVWGDTPVGQTTRFELDIINIGEQSVNFTNGQSNKFISVTIEPSMLEAGSTGKMLVDFKADAELDLGEFAVEISIVSDDKYSPYKFLTLITNLVEGNNAEEAIYDSLPHIVFDHYNHDYGHMKRGKVIYHTFIITNDGSEPLYVYDIEVPKGISVIDAPISPVMPWEKTILRLKINTRGRVGVQHHTILVNSNDIENPLVILGLHGSVRVYPNHKKPENQCGDISQKF
ncbi:MAG: DUF1573 domain-containing protein [Bacteroidales bacterium]|jgi:hypothetical protein|nr:DUF1573 domain-containing protein [Bacteroidales bacterium]MDG2080719.1 DUF1573 domain-containing protein [Bacteroidales bacterium]|tara:strand:+ start:1385 stop:2218 length:834 start_codon:yes stop_codon:yes gene_type:complete